ncbi:MAG: hypothetical protein PUC12_11085 [Clostridiales bacterium]|nr:hypothetical protein [Clostridiales bacterium]
MKKLLKKDILHYYKSAGLLLCLLASCVTPLINCVLYSDFEQSIVEISLGISFVFMSPMIICIVISLLLTSSFAIEIKDKTIIYLFANRIKQQDIWISKLIAAFVLAYVTLIVSSIIFEVAVYMQWSFWIKYSFEQILLMYLIFPVISLAFSAILWLLMWVTKSLGNMIAGIFPTGLYMFSIYFCQTLVDKNIDINWYVVLSSIIVTLIVLALIHNAIRKVSKEYWVNIHR